MKKIKPTNEKETMLKLPPKTGILIFDLIEEKEAWQDACNADQMALLIWDFEETVLRSIRKYDCLNGKDVKDISGAEMFNEIQKAWFSLKQERLPGL